MRGGSKKNGFKMVTIENYQQIHGYINDRIEHFSFNSENWVLALFKKIPTESSPEAVVMLNDWINQYLPKRVVREISVLSNL
ncbi:MAG: hypothetical protein HQL68_10085 [Magnetococcales bacterium]|nr:hypothetical protein [Magnetococcales bacterium]